RSSKKNGKSAPVRGIGQWAALTRRPPCPDHPAVHIASLCLLILMLGLPDGGPPADEDFAARVKNLDDSVNELKEKVFRTRARLLLLQETVLGGDVTSGARAVLVHRNEMGSAFYLEGVSYALDGAPIFNKADNDGD